MNKKDILLKGTPRELVTKVDNALNSLDGSKEYCTLIYEKRNLKMNDTFYGWCRILANDQGYTFEDFKSYFLIRNGHYNMVNLNLDKTKRKTKVPKSSSDLSKKEFSMMLNDMQVFAAEIGVDLPSAEDDEIILNFNR